MIRFGLCIVLVMIGQVDPASGDPAHPRSSPELQVGGLLRIEEHRDESSENESAPQGESSLPSVSVETVSASLAETTIGDDSHAVDVDGGQHPDIAITVTDSLSLGLGYRWVEAEDLSADLRANATLKPDHQSHHVLIRLAWHFQEEEKSGWEEQKFGHLSDGDWPLSAVGWSVR